VSFSSSISGDDSPEGVLAFAEPGRDRMVLPIDEPSDQLYHTITHESHARLRVRHHPARSGQQWPALWVDEGCRLLAGGWNPIDLM
jgi:hypothetical protein